MRIPHPIFLTLAVPVLMLALGCGDDGSPAGVDAALDGGHDGGPAPRDSGRASCEPACPGLDICCAGPGGVASCTTGIEDPDNCGECGIVCLGGDPSYPEGRRGTHCALSRCVCGDVEMGCVGTRDSTCCPPRPAGGMPYCADLNTDSSDCGACDAQCDPLRSDRCDGGGCLCGEGRRQCDGTPGDQCCQDTAGVTECADTTTDRRHCGACGNACQLGEVCRDGTCGNGTTPCPGGCGGAADEICCDGLCCARFLCDRGACGMDAGV